MQPKVFIIILNWNGWKDTLECLESLKDNNYQNYQVVVVDNGSTNQSVEKLEEYIDKSDKFSLLDLDVNWGFSGGNNIGIRYALKNGADYVLLLNNDTVVDKNFLVELVKAAGENPEAGLFGSKIYYYDEQSVILSKAKNPAEKAIRQDPSSASPPRDDCVVWFAGGQVNWISGKGVHIGLNEIDKGQYNKLRKVDYITGCCLLIKKEVIDKIGFLDEDYFLYYEDTDYSWRAKKAGYDRIFVPQSKIWHKCSIGTQEGSPSYIYYHARNRLLLIWKNASFFVKIIIHFIVFWKIIKQIFKAIFIPQKRIWAKYIILGISDFYLGKRGKYENWH